MKNIDQQLAQTAAQLAALKRATAKPVGRPKTFTDAELVEKQAVHREDQRERISKTSRDIAPLPTEKINWERRLSTRDDLKLFSEIYLPRVFYMPWSSDQLRCVKRIQDVAMRGGQYAIAMPRAGGKSALCRSGIIWATAHSHRVYVYLIASTAPNALETLELIKGYWFRSIKLQNDFPEIGYAVDKLDNRFQKAKGQIFLGEPTHIEWGANSVRYPCLLMPEEIAHPYIKHDKDFLVWNEDTKSFITKNAGAIITTDGIEGSIRGAAKHHPITLEQLRPDLVLLDDVQKDENAESPAACAKLTRRIDGAVKGLAGPAKKIATIMPCTVSCCDDVSDTYLDRTKKPEWRGERCSMVTSWPEGITDTEISDMTEPGRLWIEYSEIRLRSLRVHEDIRLATEFYSKNREAMDKDFETSWKERFNEDELSSQQNAMNLRLENPMTFLSEFQNKPRRTDADKLAMLIKPRQLAEKTIALNRRCVPADCDFVVGMIDVQNEIMFYSTLAVSRKFTGLVCDYGTWPKVQSQYFQKSQTEIWSLLTDEFFNVYPNQRHTAITVGGRIRAPLEAKIYHALGKVCDHILGLKFHRADGVVLNVERLAIDVGWGKTNAASKQFCREYGRREIVPYQGVSMRPMRKQYDEYERTGKYENYLFEDQVSPQVAECKWVYKPDPSGQFVMSCDVNRMKTFLHSRLASPVGSAGSISLFKAEPEEHEMFSQHVCNSEYPEPETARGMTKEIWLERQGRPNNDFFDTLVGCCAMASMMGAALHTGGEVLKPKRKKRKLSELYKQKAMGAL